MEKYYVTADVTRPMAAAEQGQVSEPGKIFVGRCKTIVQANSPALAIASGAADISNTLGSTGLEACNYGCMPIKMAAELGDGEIYEKYPTASAILDSYS